jgi:predicted Zn-dependent peptidase
MPRAVALVLLLGLVPATLQAQQRLVVVTESGTPMVGMEVLMAVGPLDEDPEQGGMTYLAARALVHPIRPLLEEIGASVLVHSNKDAVSFSLLAAPDAWEEASRRLMVALFRDPVDSAATERQRSAILTELAGRAANPADVLAAEADLAFWGPEHPWGRPAVGTPESVRRIRFADVDAFLRQAFVPSRTFVAVVGPIERDAAAAHLISYLGSEAPTRAIAPPGDPSGPLVRRDYNAITTWVSASYRFAPDADLEALRLLTHLATESLAFGPRRPGIYNSAGEIFARAGEGEIRLQIVVQPDAAEEWSTAIREAVGQFNRPLPSEVFEQSIRSFRGTRLLALNAPEARARELARQLFLTGTTTPLTQFHELTPARLLAATRSLRAPVVLMLGPTPRSEE